MQTNDFKKTLKAAVRVLSILPFAAVMAYGQATVNLTAGPATATMPDGSPVPMWGYSCGTAVGGTCAKLNPAATGWSPVVITVPTGQPLTINLTNNLSFTPAGSTTPNNVPTSLMIVGQLGGGLGKPPTTVVSPDHTLTQPTTWPIANTGATFTGPPQGPRVQSFSTEVAAGATTPLTWAAPRPGTYLIESGTHPSIQGPMGLYGMLVVTTAPSGGTPGIAYTGVNYNAEVPLLLSEIDPVQNNAVNTAVNTAGFNENKTIQLYLGGGVGLIAVSNGGAGYTSAPNVSFTGGGGSGATAVATIDSDPTSATYRQVVSIAVTNAGTGYTSNPTVNLVGGGYTTLAAATPTLTLGTNSIARCGPACYPPAVNYTPMYYLFNGVAFDKTNSSTSLFKTSPATGVPATGTVLVRFVNAGSRMHVPSIVGAQTGASGGGGFSLIAEDGNPLPGVPRVQSEVFLAAGKTYDVMVNVPATGALALPVYDRQLSLSANGTGRDAGMLAYIGINGSGLPTTAALASAVANADTYNSVVAGHTLTVSDPGKGVIANDVNVYGVKAATQPTQGTLTLNTNGTFTYVAGATWATSDSFTYCGNGATSGAACATVTLGPAPIEKGSGITVNPDSYTSNMATSLSIKSPGILSNDSDKAGYPLTVAVSSVIAGPGLTVNVDKSGAFNASVTAPGTYTFTYSAQNSQGTLSASAATVTLIFPQPSGLSIKLMDGKTKAFLNPVDYRWIIEEDRTFFVDPTKTTNTGGTTAATVLPTFGTNFHTSYMPVVATGCVGSISCEAGQTQLGQPVVCDVGNGDCRKTATQQTAVDPGQVYLDPTKHYYISVLPGDGATPFETGNQSSGHGMGGAPLAYNGSSWVTPSITPAGQGWVTVIVEPTPLPPSKLTVFVFQDDNPLNGEQDSGGGVDVLAPNEPGLGGFNITIFDDAGGPGDPTGQVNYDMFNQPLSNSLAGTPDPSNNNMDACPISKISRIGVSDPTQTGITGTIVTCPKYEADGVTLSPLAGQAVIANMMPGRYGVVATPSADRIARGEEWLQTNTLDGQKAHDSFLKVGEPSFFQEYGPASFHVSIGFANPAIINSRLAGVCAGTDINITGTNCTNTVTGRVTTERMSRTPDERLYSSGSRDSFAFSQCYVSFGDPDGEDFAFTKCAADGTFTISGLPDGDWRVTTFDQWNDQLVDGLSWPVRLAGGVTSNMGDMPANQWQANFNTRTFLDLNKDGVSQSTEPGLALVKTNVRFRDGSFSNRNNTDLNGNAAFNEEFPLFNWYVLETDVTRYKNTGTHVVYDAGGPADGTPACGQVAGAGYPACGTSTIGKNMANTNEAVPLPNNLRVPGAVYCSGADCIGSSIATGPVVGGSSGPGGSTGRIDPPWVLTYGWQGFSGQNNFLEFGKTPYAAGETGGIRGHVVYSSTRPFDDPQFGTQNVWEPLVPGVTINLYKEGTAPDGSQSLTLVDTTKTSSFDDWAQGFRSDGIPNMNCPGQTTADLFYFSLYNQPNYLNLYNSQHGGPAVTPLPNNAQFKCYDGMHNWNQLQPAPYDGMYQFPSVTGMDPKTGKPTGTNCTACVTNPDTSDPYRSGIPMLAAGKYVVEVVVPPGFELVKEEDKNILIGDNFIAPVTVQFPGLGSSIFILPDQAQVGSSSNNPNAANYNPNNAQNPTQHLGRNATLESHEGDTPTVDTFWPCVGATRIVPDYISLYPQSREVAPFAGATRNLCDRKEVTLDEQTSAQAEFFIFTSTHIAAHFTGVITDDFTSEFDPFSPQFGEKFAPPDLPVSVKDWAGNEVSRVYADHWGTYNGLNYSTWEVNPPNPTGYSPTMMVMCMNDPGQGTTPDPLFNPGYSQFCYELPFMPGQTQYMDTPVTPTSAFSEGYNHPDCAYPDATPAISEVDGDGMGPWVSAPGKTLTIKALGDLTVINNGYSGPSATKAPFNAKTVNRHYGFGSTQGTVTIGGVAATVTSNGWSDTQITVTVPAGVPACGIQQQALYGGSQAQCGELIITAANGKSSIDSVTVTVGGKKPTYVTTTIQSAIDTAAPGDLIIVPPGVYKEILLMWKPVRLQGVGAASSVINANTHPGGKLDPWRRQVNCLFGLALNGQPLAPASGTSPGNPFDSTGTYSCGSDSAGNPWVGFVGGPNNPQVDRLPLEGILGWDTTVNGNLAQLLQEPTLMGAYEGAGITVLAKGVNIPAGSTNIFGSGAESAFPTGTLVLTSNDCLGTTGANPYPSNFQCNPSSIDGLSITNASQGGGGIFVHAWGHNLQIANNRVYNNSGTLTGGITIGQGESPDAYLAGTAADSDPGSCVVDNNPADVNKQLPYCFDLKVNLHNNSISLNSSIGDELFSSTPAGAGGVTFCTGADYYKFNYNWVCGNLSTGDGGGLVHLGYIYNGDIEHNSILFNQSTNPTVPTNGGGIMVMGAPPDGFTAAGVECGATAADADCTPGLSDGTGPNLTINANLIMGNAAASGSGGGLRFQGVNGTEVSLFPKNPENWNSVNVTNNIIANNVAGWDGAGVSLQDALVVNVVNNTIVSNDTTASAGVLFNTLGAPIASSTGPTCTVNCGTQSAPQPSGLVTMRHSTVLTSSFAGIGPITCPAGHYSGANPNNGACRTISFPILYNNLFWQNRDFHIGVGGLSTQYQQNIVSLFNGATSTPAASQPQGESATANGSGVTITGGTGACVSGSSYWDIGVRGDTGPTNHGSGFTLAPMYSVLTSTAGYAAENSNNIATPPGLVTQYCNGSRTPPEFGSSGYQVPPGISDATVPNPIFSLTPAATVDEGNNWINISWGPLAMTNPVTGVTLGNYSLAAGSPAIDAIPPTAATYTFAPDTDFFGNPRPNTEPATGPQRNIDIGAVEFIDLTFTTPPSLSPASLNFPSARVGIGSAPQTVTLTAGTLPLNSISAFFGSPAFSRADGTCGTTLAAGATCTINVVFSPTAVGAVTSSMFVTALSGTTNVVVTNSPVTLTGTGFVPAPTLSSIAPSTGVRGTTVPVTLTGANLTGATAVTVSGAGVTVSGITVVNDTTVTATFTITATAAATARNVSVTTLGGASNTVTFTVQGPTLTTIAPISGVRGHVVPVTLTGTNLTGATAVTVSGTGVTVSAVTAVNSTTVTATFTITATAGISARNVAVVTPIGTTGNVTFNVTGPTLSLIAPNSGLRNTTVPVTLTGVGLTGATAITVAGTGVTVNTLVVVSDTSVTANFVITAGATLSGRNVAVVTPNGTTNNVTFTVGAPPAPTLTGIAPASGFRGASVPVTLTGTNLTGTSAVTVSGTGVTVSAITVVSDTSVTATFTITSGATLSSRNVNVTTPGGTSGNVAFLVQAPTLASIAPNTGVRGTSVPVTLTGTGLTGSTGLTGLPTGVTIATGTFTVASDTSITATLNISASATLGAANISVVTPGGNTGTQPFTVQGPTIASMTPNTGVRGTGIPVTITGANLTGATAVTISGTGVTASLITAVGSTSVTATFTIATAAALGGRTVTVTTPIGTSTGTVTFTVTGATVAFAGPTPALTTATADTTTKTGTVTVSNAAAATGPLTLTAGPTIAKAGTAGGTFTITGGTCISGASVNPGTSCTIIVQYAPGTSVATATANVTIAGSGLAAATLTSANFTAN